MRVHHRLHVRPRLVNAGVKMELERRLAVAGDQIAIEVDHADVVDRELAALARADIDEHPPLAGPHAGMTIVVHDALSLEHADAAHDLLLLFGLVHTPTLAPRLTS